MLRICPLVSALLTEALQLPATLELAAMCRIEQAQNLVTLAIATLLLLSALGL